MKAQSYILLPSGDNVPVKAYIKAVKRAKSHPKDMFDRNLISKRKTTGAKIYGQFLYCLHYRITSNKNYLHA